MADTVRIEISLEATDNTGKAISDFVNNLNKVNTAAGKMGTSTGKATEQVSKFDRQADKTQKTLQGWLRQKWEVALEAKDKISPILNTLKSGLSSITSRAWNITVKAFDLVTAPIRGIFNLLRNPIFQAGSILGVSIGLKDTIDTFRGFEAAMSQVQAISGASAGELDKLTAKAKEMGATTKFTAEEAASAFNYMAMAGWKTSDMMSGIDGILNLAAASGEDLGTTSDIVTDALTAFGMQASDATHFADVLAAASSNANTNVGMMGETFKYVGAMAGTLGYSIEDVGLAVGLMANAGIKSSQAGTELNAIFTRLSVNTNHARDAIEGLGINFFDSTGTARPFVEVLDELRDAMSGMTDEQKTEIANTIAGQRAQAGLLAMINASEADYEKLAEAVSNADGASKRMADTMLDNLSGSFTLLQSAVDGAKISLGERLAPYLREFADGITARMPQIQQGIANFMDWFDGKVADFKGKLHEVTSSEEFQNADFFGKVKILWDEIVAEPFVEWWETTGKEKVASVAGDIGSGIGTALKTGLLTLLGIDISEGTEEGVSIGRSFAEGFAAGFDKDTVGRAFRGAISGMLQDVGKILPGGEAPGLDTAISGLLLYKMASPIMALGGGVGKALFGKGASGGASLAGSLIGSSAAGTGLLGLGANTAISLGAGNLAGGASLGSGALAGVGLGAIAGGAVGGAAAVSGVVDLVKSAKEEDEMRKDMLRDTGGMKLGGVAAGAATGAAIGSVVPVLGTAAGALIGAGVGGIAGFFGSRRRKQEYEEQVKAQEEAAAAAEAEAAALQLVETKAAATGAEARQFKTSNDALRDAFNDTSVSAEQFSAVLRIAAAEKIQSAFGNITLSLQEIKDLASSIVFDGMADEAEKFQNAVATADDALTRVKADVGGMEKLNWKASLGIAMSEDDLATFQQQADQFAKDAQTYLTDKHYEAYVAMRLVTNGEGDTSGLDAAYASVKEQVEGLTAQLQEEISAALADGEISTRTIELNGEIIEINELEAVTSLQNQISDIINMVSEAENEASLQMLSIKYGGANLSAESFQQLQQELQTQVAAMTQNYDEATQAAIASVNLQLKLGQIDQSEADAQIEELRQNYQSQIGDMNLRVEGFQLDTIAEAFGGELESALESARPELEGTTSEKLKEIMDSALAVSPEPMEWTQDQISEWFGLEGLDAEAQVAIGEMLRSVAETVPDTVKQQINEAMNNLTMEEAQETLKTTLGNGIAEAISGADMTGAYSNVDALRQTVENYTQEVMGAEMAVEIPVEVTYNYNVTNPEPPAPTGAANVSRSYQARTRGLSARANGGFTNGAELSWIGEDGPEAIIPLGAKRRERGLELYEQVGEILGVAKNANGGVYGKADIIPFPGATAYDAQKAPETGFSSGNGNFLDREVKNGAWGYSGDYAQPDEGRAEGSGGSYAAAVGGTPVTVTVSMNPSFTIEGAGDKSEDEIVGILQRHIKEMADEIGGEVAERLIRVYENMPLKGAV